MMRMKDMKPLNDHVLIKVFILFHSILASGYTVAYLSLFEYSYALPFIQVEVQLAHPCV